MWVDDYQKAEKIIHMWFHNNHVAKEFFDITVPELEAAVRQLLKPIDQLEAMRELIDGEKGV